MGKRFYKFILCFAVLLSVAVLNTFQVAAVNLNKECSLTLNECLPGLNVHLYHVADISDEGNYHYTEAFSKASEETNIRLDQLKTSEQLKEAAITLKGYAVNQKAVTKKADSSTLTFDHLQTGLYLITTDLLEYKGQTYTYLPYLIQVPQDGENHVAIDFTKYSKIPSHEYSIVKHWQDHGTKHPDKIEVELYEDTKYVKTIILSASHNYAYSWKSDHVTNYSIKEKKVPGYKGIVSCTSHDTKTEYVITNTKTGTHSSLTSHKGSQVKTGDSTQLAHWVTLMACAGLLFIIVGKVLKHEKD